MNTTMMMQSAMMMPRPMFFSTLGLFGQRGDAVEPEEIQRGDRDGRGDEMGVDLTRLIDRIDREGAGASAPGDEHAAQSDEGDNRQVSTAKMTISTPRVIVMPRMVMNVFSATKAMTHTYQGLPGTSITPQFATITYSRAGVMQ